MIFSILPRCTEKSNVAASINTQDMKRHIERKIKKDPPLQLQGLLEGRHFRHYGQHERKPPVAEIQSIAKRHRNRR